MSDTHLPRFGRVLPRELRNGLTAASVDLILHLGDFTSPEAADLFEAIAPFDAVAGNNDPPELVERFGRRKIVDVGGIRIGMTHGDLGVGRSSPERAVRSFSTDELDVILFGHSHIPVLRRLADGPWLMNPGSPTDRRGEPRYSWGLIEIAPSGEVAPELRFYDDRRP